MTDALKAGLIRRNALTPWRLICDTPERMDGAAEWLGDCALLAVDVETIPHVRRSKRSKARLDNPQPIAMTVVSYSGVTDENEMRSYAFQLTTRKSSIANPPQHLGHIIQTIRHINTNNVRKTLHNGVYDAAWFLRYGAPLREWAYDSMVMWWARYPDLPKTLDFVSSILLDDYAYWKMGRKEEDFLAHTAYAMQDTECTLRNTIRLLPWLRTDTNMRRNFMMAMLRCLAGLEMTMRGCPIDFEQREKLRLELESDREQALAHFRLLAADPEANPNSPKQMKKLFYGMLGAEPHNARGRPIRKVTRKNQPSTGFFALRAIEGQHPILRAVVTAYNNAKKPAKQLSNVMGIEFMDGRFRTNYHGCGTTTSRFSSSSDQFGFGDNAQNIRKKYRSMIRADDGCLLLEVDFSASDDIFMSYESEEPKKIELIESGRDTHSYNASEVFFTNWTYADVVAGKKNDDPRVVDPITGIRQITKKTTHGANYLMAGMTLLMTAGRDAIIAAAQVLGHPDAGSWSMARLAEFCEYLDNRYRLFYPRFARAGQHSFYTDLQRGLVKRGSFTTCFNYRQRFQNDPLDQATLRACAATVGQANTAGRVNLAMDELVHGARMVRFRDGEAPDANEPALRITEREHGASVRFQTHDSLTFNIDPSHTDWREGVKRILHVMRRPVLCRGRVFSVGIEADVQVHWAKDAREIHDVAGIESWLGDNLQQVS